MLWLPGDYYFKERDFARCIKYFQLDICINPLRVDSWAGLALSYVAQLENSLNYCEKLKNESEFFDKAKSAQICFRRALELDPENLVLWIECGSFEYLVHSFCSRLLKYESENFSMEKWVICSVVACLVVFTISLPSIPVEAKDLSPPWGKKFLPVCLFLRLREGSIPGRFTGSRVLLSIHTEEK